MTIGPRWSNPLSVLVGLCALAAATGAQAQGTFAYRKAITINQNGARPVLNDFPVLVSINGDPDLISKVQNASGADIEFKAADGVTKLPFEVDYFYRPSGTLMAWVRVPTLAPGANTIYMDYGNAQITRSPGSPCKVWDQDYVGVWHLGESGNGSVNEFRDSSPFGNDGQGGQGDPLFVPTQVNGKIGLGQHFDNSDTKYDVVDCGDDASVHLTGNQITLQAWVQHNVVPPQSHSYGILASKGWSDGYSLWMQGNPFDCPVAALCISFNAPGQFDRVLTNQVVSAGSWHQVVATYDGTALRVYIDGVADVNTTAKSNHLAPSTADQPLFIGHGDQPKDVGWSSEWEGDLDEVRISRVARSPDWIATEFDNQSTTCTPASAFCSVGAEVPGSYGTDVTPIHYRSIGTNAATLASTGTATSTAGSASVSFSASLPANVGAGDLLTLDPGGTPESLYILSRDSATQLTLQSASASSRSVAFTITRAYNTLAAWEQDIGLGGRGGDLVADDRSEVGVVYNDAPFTSGVTIDGSTTDCSHTLVLTSPQGQHHLGVAGTGAVIDNGASASPAIRILDDYVTVEWLEIKGGTGAAADAIEIGNGIGTLNHTVVRYNLLHDTSGDGIRSSDPDSVADISNNFIYQTNYGVHFTADMTDEARVNVFNNTVYGSNGTGGSPSGITTDVRQTSVRIDARNNIVHSNTNGDMGLVHPFDAAYFCNPGCTQVANGGTVPSATEYLADPANNLTLSFATASDFLYLGSARKFRGFSTNLVSGGTGTADIQWEYWNGASWTSLETNGFANYGNDFRYQGICYWPDDPAGWTTVSVSGSPNLYYVRGKLASGTWTTAPVESTITPVELSTASRNNLTGDFTATPHSLAAAGGTGIDAASLASLNFISTTPGAENLHITAGSTAQDTAYDLSSQFTGDIDGGLRTAPWDIGADDIDATTAVELVSFDGVGLDGAVVLTWETGAEIDNLGFVVYRRSQNTEDWTRLNPTLIPGLGSSPQGASYRYVDSDVVNGKTYSYRLEDVEISGRTTSHGPVTATPGGTAGSCCPHDDPQVPVTTVGDPASNRLRIRTVGANEIVLELWTNGFFLTADDEGTAELNVPDYDPLTADGFPDLPVRRAWVDALAGRRVRVSSVETFDESRYQGLRLSGGGSPIVEASRDGSLRPSRGRPSRGRDGGRHHHELYPAESARLLSVGFQGDAKKALVELAPFRWDGETLILYRRVVVRLSLRGRDVNETVRANGQGRRYRQRPSQTRRAVAARLETRERGLYAVRFEDLFGSRRKPVKPSSLRLSRLGVSVPFHLEPNSDRFGPGSVLYFLSAGGEANPYGRQAVYEIELVGAGGAMKEIDLAPRGSEVTTYWNETVSEENRYYQATLLDAPDRWLWDLLVPGTRKAFSIEASALSPEAVPARLSIWLQGVSDIPNVVDHHLLVFFDGASVGEVALDGKQAKRFDLELPPGILQEGVNTVELESVGDPAAPWSMVMLDKIGIRYRRESSVFQREIEGTWSESGTAVVRGVRRGLVLDTTTGTSPLWLSNVSSDGSTVRFPVEEGHRYLVWDAGRLLHPVVTFPPPEWLKREDLQADYLIVAPRAFLNAAEPLVDERRRQGLRVLAVPVESIFSEFGFGEERPEAIRDFLAYAYHRWRTPSIRYVLLLGDASYDTKDYLGTGAVNWVPALPFETSYLWTVSDPAYAAVNGEDLLPDFAIGRLPAASMDQAEQMVRKILDYETSGASPSAAGQGPIVLVADNADAGGNFPADADRLRPLLADRPLEKIIVGTEPVEDTRTAISEAFARASLVSYLGHGGIHLWASEDVFDIQAVPKLEPRPDPPLVLTMNCLNGYFDFPYFDSLAEALVKAEDKGAVAVFSPSGLSLNDPAMRYEEAILRELFSGSHRRLGDALMAAQEHYATMGALPELLAIYHLFGDPALVLSPSR